MLNWVITILTFSLLFGGNNQNQRTAPCRVVTEITIQYTDEGSAVQKRYIRQDKMNKVLNYIRSLDPKPARNAPPEDVQHFEITLTLSDGTTVRYTQYGLEYLRNGDLAWQSIDPDQAIRLPLILAAIPGDTD